MTLCQFYAACSEETLTVILTAKEEIEQMIKNKNYDRKKLKEQEQIVCQALDGLLFCVDSVTHLAVQVNHLKYFAIQGFVQTSGEINEDGLKEVCRHLEALHYEISSVSV